LRTGSVEQNDPFNKIQGNGEGNRTMKKHSTIIFYCLLVGIFVWGIALRAVEVINHNYLFGFDMGRDYLAAYNIVHNHKMTLIGAEVGAGSAGLSGIFHGPGYFYLIALVYKLFNGDPYGGLLLMFFFGVATLLIAFLSVRKMFGLLTATVTLFLIGVSPLITSQSRFLWNHHPTSFFIALVLYFSYMITKKPRLYAPMAIFTAGIIYHFELAMAVPLVVTLCIALPIVFRCKDIKTYLYSLIAVILSFFPAALFEARHGWMAVRSLWSYLGTNSQTGNGVSYLRFTDHLGSYISNAKNSFIMEARFLPDWTFNALIVFLLIAIIYFSFKLKDKIKRKFFQFLFLMIFISYGILMFLNNSVWDYYLIHLHFVFIYAFAFCFSNLVTTFRTSLWSKIGSCVFGIFLLSMLNSSYKRMLIDYRYDLTDLGGVEKIQGKKVAIDYVYKDAAGKPFSEFTFMAPIYTYPYDYLFLTYAKKKYGYSPGNTKKGLVYLIIEPDNSKPWTYKGWLETVIVGGTVLDTKTLYTGHIIQKRMFPL
jgi:hypothetical protein